ncbi:MAG TPA: tetratricopeptide repeat protein [Firmicutes bacterium]|nr:tetratricopeptide repeat protein [Candidatus Fermentithermobacillaceae bacterium]
MRSSEAIWEGIVAMLVVYLIIWVIDIMGWKRLSRLLWSKVAVAGAPDYIVSVAARKLVTSGAIAEAEKLCREHLRYRPAIRVGRILINVLLRDGRAKEAAEVARTLVKAHPENPWVRFLWGDIHYFFMNDQDTARAIYYEALDVARRSPDSRKALKIAYKRVYPFLEKEGRYEEAAKILEEFMLTRASNFHDVEFLALYNILRQLGRLSEAREVLREGIKAYPPSKDLRKAWEESGFEGGEDLPPIPARGKPVPPGVAVTPVKTRLFTEVDDPIPAVASVVTDVLPGDIVTVSSCVTGVMEGRFLMEGSWKPGYLARFFSGLVDQKNPPYGGAAPMANPLSMQLLVEEIGTLRLLLAAVAGALGKLFGKKGWFYVVAGPDSALIDDVPGSLPPYDYYCVMGPENSFRFSEKLSCALGCGAAVIDANDAGIAWAVGYSRGLNKEWLEEVMSSNPAGNQEQRTPIVVLRVEKEPSLSRRNLSS